MAGQAVGDPDSCSTQFILPADDPPDLGLPACPADHLNFTGSAADRCDAVDPLKIEFGAALPGNPPKIKSEPELPVDLKTEASGDGYQEGEEETRPRPTRGRVCVTPAAVDHQETRHCPERRSRECPATGRHVTTARRLQASAASHWSEDQNELSESSGRRQQERFRCHVCSKPFRCRSWLEKHARTHSGQKPYSCEFCQKAFTQRSSLNKHVRCQHSGEQKPFRCNVCEKSFSTKCYLRVHEASHSGEHQAACKVCRRTFSHVKLLKIHLKVHSGRFRCDVCDKAFSCQSKLDTHVHRHSVGMSLECSLCSDVFMSRASLNRHVGLKHPVPTKPFGCDVCGRTVSSKRSLLVHVSSHTTEHQVSCGVCSKSFSHQRLLYQHRKSHVKQGRRSASRRVSDT